MLKRAKSFSAYGDETASLVREDVESVLCKAAKKKVAGLNFFFGVLLLYFF